MVDSTHSVTTHSYTTVFVDIGGGTTYLTSWPHAVDDINVWRSASW